MMNTKAAALDERFEQIPIAQLVSSKTNPRKHFDEAYLAQLSASVAEKGVIEPIVVRQVDAGSHHPLKFEIVAGECRFRAAKLAELPYLPAVIRAYTDEQALEVQLVENICRHDLTPLEQATGYRALIKTSPTKHSADTIAIRIGMSVAWVWDRLKLNDLVPEAKALLEQERMAVGHAILIARLKPEDQARVIDPGNGRNGYNAQRDGLWQYDGGRLLDADDAITESRKDKYGDLKPVSIRELDTWIREHVRFDVAHAAKAVPLEFEPVAAAVAAAEAKPGRGKKVIPITFSYRVADDARDGDQRTYGSESWKRADGTEKSKTCEHSVLGVVAAGSRHYGEAFEVCVARDKCPVHFGDVLRQKEQNAKLRESGQTSKAAKNEAAAKDKYQQQREQEAAKAKAWDALLPRAIAALVEHLKKTPLTAALVQASLYSNDAHKLVGVLKPENFGQVLALNVVFRHGTWSREHFLRAVKPFKFDLKAVERDAAPKAATKPAAVVAGTCRHCGCTDGAPCISKGGETCAWVDKTRTLCSNPACLKKAGKPAAKKAGKKGR